jgi:hypothetical protein
VADGIKNFTIGKDLYAVKVSPLTIAANGAITVGAARSLKGYIDSVRMRIFKATDKIMSVDTNQANTVSLYSDYQLVLSEKKRRRSTSGSGPIAGSTTGDGTGSILPMIAANFSAVRVEFTQCTVNGVASTGETYVCYGEWTDFDDGTSGQGGQVCTLTIEPIDLTGLGGSTSSVVLDTTSSGAAS